MPPAGAPLLLRAPPPRTGVLATSGEQTRAARLQANERGAGRDMALRTLYANLADQYLLKLTSSPSTSRLRWIVFGAIKQATA